MKESIYDYKVKDIDGNEVAMSEFKDKVLMIVNVASKVALHLNTKGFRNCMMLIKTKVWLCLVSLATNLELKSKWRGRN